MTLPKSWESERVRKMSHEERIEYLEKSLRISELKVSEYEQRIEHLRVSRRVLMNLLDKVERENSKEVSRLEKLLQKERKRKYMVHRTDPLWKTHVMTFEQVADELEKSLINMGQLTESAKLEIAGVRENALNIRNEFYLEDIAGKSVK